MKLNLKLHGSRNIINHIMGRRLNVKEIMEYASKYLSEKCYVDSHFHNDVITSICESKLLTDDMKYLDFVFADNFAFLVPCPNVDSSELDDCLRNMSTVYSDIVSVVKDGMSDYTWAGYHNILLMYGDEKTDAYEDLYIQSVVNVATLKQLECLIITVFTEHFDSFGGHISNYKEILDNKKLFDSLAILMTYTITGSSSINIHSIPDKDIEEINNMIINDVGYNEFQIILEDEFSTFRERTLVHMVKYVLIKRMWDRIQCDN